MKLLHLLPIGNLDGGLLMELAPALAEIFHIPCELVRRPLNWSLPPPRAGTAHSSEILQAMQNM
jgi:hypothetical protein